MRTESLAERLDLEQRGDRRTVDQGAPEAEPIEPGSASLERLTDAERAVYVSVIWNGNEPAQFARKTDRAPSTARTLLQRAREKMGVSA